MKTAQSPTSNRMLFNVKVLLPVLQTCCRTQDFSSWHLYCQIFESLKCCWILADSPLFLKLDACLRSRPECQWQLSHKIHTPHYFILELEILCHIPHHTTLSEIQVYILNFLSLAYCRQCAFNGICILMSWIDLDFPRMEKPLLHLSKCVSHVWQVQKSGPHCHFTQLFDQCRDVVDF